MRLKNALCPAPILGRASLRWVAIVPFAVPGARPRLVAPLLAVGSARVFPQGGGLWLVGQTEDRVHGRDESAGTERPARTCEDTGSAAPGEMGCNPTGRETRAARRCVLGQGHQPRVVSQTTRSGIAERTSGQSGADPEARGWRGSGRDSGRMGAQLALLNQPVLVRFRTQQRPPAARLVFTADPAAPGRGALPDRAPPLGLRHGLGDRLDSARDLGPDRGRMPGMGSGGRGGRRADR